MIASLRKEDDMGGYMRIDNDNDNTLTGNVLRAGKRWIEITQFTFDQVSSVSATTTNHGGKVAALSRTVNITLPVRANTPAFIRAAKAGTDLGNVIVEITRGADKSESVTARLTFTDASVSGLRFDRKGDTLSQTLSLDCAGVKFEPS